MLPFKEMRQFTSEMEQFVAALASQHGLEHLDGPQGFVLSHLFRHPEEDLSFKDIEQHMKVTKSVISSLIKRMEKNGFVYVETSPKDKRIKFVRLTEFGKEKASRLSQFTEELHQVILSGISLEDARIARQVLGKVQQNMQQALHKGEEHVSDR